MHLDIPRGTVHTVGNAASDNIKFIVVATKFTIVQSLSAVTQYMVLHYRATNRLTAAKGAGEENEAALSHHGVKVFL